MTIKPSPRLYFFCGHAGAGKTTLARHALPYLIEKTQQPWAFLDKDTLYAGYSAHVMNMLTGDPNDRDSPVYLSHLRQAEYQGLLDTAKEQLQLGISALVVSPFSQEIKTHRLNDKNWLRVDPHIELRVVWVKIPETLARSRIEARHNPRDNYKLAHWEAYRTRLFQPTEADFPELTIITNENDPLKTAHTLVDRLLKTSAQSQV